MSTNSIHLDIADGIATLTMDMPSANAINIASVTEFEQRISDILDNPDIRAVILTSAHPKIFSPGLDLFETLNYDRPTMTTFFTAFTQLFYNLFTLPKPLIAAINGHAIAGGFCLTLTADYRVAAEGNAKFGLNELKVGVALPHGIVQMLQATVAPAVARDIAYFGNNVAVTEAKHIGIIDELCNPETLLPRAQEIAALLAEKPATAFAATKRYVRSRYAEAMQKHELAEAQTFLDIWFHPETQVHLQSAVNAIKK